jgi:hypothetical protein
MRFFSVWDDNTIQFARLLAEINAIGLTMSQYQQICDSTDLGVMDIDELLERAEKEFEEIKLQMIR